MLAVGDTAPDFTLPDQDGKVHTLSSYRGHWVLIYFYPKDHTSGCTKEACMIRDSFPRFEGAHADVFGISGDSVESHKRFADDYHLPFPLLADTDRKVIKAYGVASRMSFLIDPTGAIKKIYEKVKPEIHAEEVLEDLKIFGA
jgi:peroxiredoxin Q/BCP